MPAVVCIRNIVNKLASIAQFTTAHPNEMSVNVYFMPRAMSICKLTASKCINSRYNMIYLNMEVRCFTELPTFLYVISEYVTCQEHIIVFHT